MLASYLKVALRVLRRDSGFTILTLLGLTAGMACCLLIALYVRHELRYDRHHTQAGRLYRVTMASALQGDEMRFASTPVALAPALAADLQGVARAVRLYGRSVGMRAATEASRRFQEDRFVFADSAVFDVFTLPLVHGDPRTALGAPGRIVLTEAMARKYFGAVEAAMGQTLLVEERYPFTVAGVMRDLPGATHFHFDFLASFDDLFAMENEAIRDYLRTDWMWNPVYTYVLLERGVDPAGVAARLPGFFRRHARDGFTDQRRLILQPLVDIHLYGDYLGEPEPQGSITVVYLFAGVALLVLVIACINFVNLATARSLRRAREVGLRKVLGAHRGQLARQFLGETMLQAGLASALATGLAWLLLPVLNQLAGTALTPAAFADPAMLAVFAAVLLVSGLGAGAYPALFLSRFRPAVVLKSSGTAPAGGRRLRQSLVVLQFAVSVALMIGTATVFEQLRYVRGKDLGFRKDQIVTVPLYSANTNALLGSAMTPELRQRMNAFEDALLSHTGVEAVTVSSELPGQGGTGRLVIPEGRRREDNVFLQWISVDYDYAEAYGLAVRAGRTFSKAYGTDHLQAFVLNETAVRALGWGTPAAAVGRRFAFDGKEGNVVGVVADYHFASLYEPVAPLVLDVSPPAFQHFSIRLRAGQVEAALAFVRQQWQRFFPERVFEHAFLDASFDALYRRDERMGRVVGCLAGLAVVVACLGLFGLAAYTAQQRTREIGIRKVLGASTTGLVALLSKEFVRLVALACLVALPLAYLLLGRWLEGFAYRITLAPATFLACALAALGIALVTVSYQTLRAATADPVRSLRYE